MDFFYDCVDEASRKERYRELSKVFHPDKSGSDKLMKELNRQYESDAQEFTTNVFHNSSRSYFSTIKGNAYSIEIERYNILLKQKNEVISSLRSQVYVLSQELRSMRIALDEMNQELEDSQKEVTDSKVKCREAAKAQLEAEKKLKEKETDSVLDNIRNYFKGKNAKQS